MPSAGAGILAFGAHLGSLRIRGRPESALGQQWGGAITSTCCDSAESLWGNTLRERLRDQDDANEPVRDMVNPKPGPNGSLPAAHHAQVRPLPRTHLTHFPAHDRELLRVAFFRLTVYHKEYDPQVSLIN